MKKLFLSIAMIFSFCLLSYAQMDEREPGLYTIVNGESVKLGFVRGINNHSQVSILGVEKESLSHKYKGATSQSKASNTFVLVIDPSRKMTALTMKKYDIFIRSTTPESLVIIPLEVVKGKDRVYVENSKIAGIRTKVISERFPFTWEQISDNSYVITTNLEPGEYAFAYRPSGIASYEFSAVFDFTIEAASEEPAVEPAAE